MDVELRARLKALGFKRKTYQTYLREGDKNRRIFEIYHHPKSGTVDFGDQAGVFNHEIGRLAERLNLNWAHSLGFAGTRSSAHAVTSIAYQVRLERRWDKIAWEEDHPPKRGWFGSEQQSRPPDVDRVLQFRSKNGMWIANPDRTLDPADWSREYDQVVDELGKYLTEMFDRHIVPWYEMCEDPTRFAQWCARELGLSRPSSIVKIAAALLADDRAWAASYIQEKLSEWERPYEAFLADEEELRPSKGWRRWIHGSAPMPWERTNEESARAKQEACQETAQDARALASEFGLSI